MNPGCVMISPHDAEDWNTKCNLFRGIMKPKYNNGDHKNDRSRCYSEVVIAVTRNGVIIKRRATRFVCGTVGGLVGYQYGEDNMVREYEHASFTFVSSWLSEVAQVVLTDYSLIEGCKADCYLKM